MPRRKGKAQTQQGLGGVPDAPQISPATTRLETIDLSTVGGMENPTRLVEPEEAHEALRESIRALGLLQPLLVKENPDGTRVLIAGYRRYRALRELGITSAPALITTSGPTALLSLAENTARLDLNPIEEAIALLTLVETGITQEALAKALGRSATWISRRLSLLALEPEVQDMVAMGELSPSVAQELLAAKSREIQLHVANVAKTQNLTEASTREWVTMLNSQSSQTPSPTADAGAEPPEPVATPPLACMGCGQTEVALRWVPLCAECLDSTRGTK